jgi:DNA-binding XRE family transcriptional regulator
MISHIFAPLCAAVLLYVPLPGASARARLLEEHAVWGLRGRQVKRERMAHGLTQEALAERAGLSARAISDLERGVNRAPRKETLRLLAEALQLTSESRAQLEEAAV